MVSINRPWGPNVVKATFSTLRRRTNCWPVRTFQTRTVLSADPVTTFWPSELKAAAITVCSCLSLAKTSPVLESQMQATPLLFNVLHLPSPLRYFMSPIIVLSSVVRNFFPPGLKTIVVALQTCLDLARTLPVRASKIWAPWVLAIAMRVPSGLNDAILRGMTVEIIGRFR